MIRNVSSVSRRTEATFQRAKRSMALFPVIEGRSARISP
jgi:hypothetical protein